MRRAHNWGGVSLPARIATPPPLLSLSGGRWKVVAAENEGITPDVRQQLKDIADRAKAKSWTPEQTRAALTVLVAEAPEVDETDKPAA